MDLPELPAETDGQHTSLVGLDVDAATQRTIAAQRVSLAGCFKPHHL